MKTHQAHPISRSSGPLTITVNKVKHNKKILGVKKVNPPGVHPDLQRKTGELSTLDIEFIIEGTRFLHSSHLFRGIGEPSISSQIAYDAITSTLTAKFMQI